MKDDVSNWCDVEGNPVANPRNRCPPGQTNNTNKRSHKNINSSSSSSSNSNSNNINTASFNTTKPKVLFRFGMIAMLSFYCIGFRFQTLRRLTVEGSEQQQQQQQRHNIEGIGYGHVYERIKLYEKESTLPVPAAGQRQVGNSLLSRIHEESIRSKTTKTTTSTTNTNTNTRTNTDTATRTRTVGAAANSHTTNSSNNNNKRRIAWPVLHASESTIPRTRNIDASANNAGSIFESLTSFWRNYALW